MLWWLEIIIGGSGQKFLVAWCGVLCWGWNSFTAAHRDGSLKCLWVVDNNRSNCRKRWTVFQSLITCKLQFKNVPCCSQWTFHKTFHLNLSLHSRNLIPTTLKNNFCKNIFNQNQNTLIDSTNQLDFTLFWLSES